VTDPNCPLPSSTIKLSRARLKVVEDFVTSLTFDEHFDWFSLFDQSPIVEMVALALVSGR
jgi:hypothetical protein